MRRIVLVAITIFFGVMLPVPSTSALSSDPKLFISADNTFYTYVKAGESISAAFLRVDQHEPFDTVRGDVTITLDGPGAQQEKCVASKDVPVGQGCRFATRTANKTGIWRIQFSVPQDARTYQEVSPDVRWAKNWFNWSITVTNGDGEERGRTWTERYAIRQPPDQNYSADLLNYYISEDGYIYKATSKGYNGQISTLSADSVGIRAGKECMSAYQSTDVGNTKYSPALGKCGNAYKLFFEEPAGDLPTKAARWDGTTDWIRPNISRPSVSELHFSSDNSSDQQSGTISFYLRNFIGQYQIKIDVDNDGSFDGQNDVVINQQMKSLSTGLQRVRFSGADKTGQIISPSQPIGIKIDITKVAEIHLVAADVEGRAGGLELVRLSGDNAPTTRLCWNDTELSPLANSALMTNTLDGRSCPDSVGGVHSWAYADDSWGNARYIDDWIYASAKLDGNNTTTYPQATDTAVAAGQRNGLLIIASIVGAGLLLAGVVAAIVIRRKRKGTTQLPSNSPLPPPQNQPSNFYETPPSASPRDPDEY